MRAACSHSWKTTKKNLPDTTCPSQMSGVRPPSPAAAQHQCLQGLSLQHLGSCSPGRWEGPVPGGSFLTTVPFSTRGVAPVLRPVRLWGTWLGHRSAGAGLCPRGTGRPLCHCSGKCWVPRPVPSSLAGENPVAPPVASCVPRRRVSAAGRTADSWTSFRPATPITP